MPSRVLRTCRFAAERGPLTKGTTMTLSFTRAIRIGAGVAAASGSALAQTVELRNDSVPPMQGQIVPQWGFIDGEIGAATFVVPANLYPLRIKRVQLFWFSLRGQSTNNIQDGIIVWNGRPGAGLLDTPRRPLGRVSAGRGRRPRRPS